MSKRIPLDRLRDLSRQRPIRRPLPVSAPAEPSEPDLADSGIRTEWPVSR